MTLVDENSITQNERRPNQIKHMNDVCGDLSPLMNKNCDSHDLVKERFS